MSVAEVREAVRQTLTRLLSPLPPGGVQTLDDATDAAAHDRSSRTPPRLAARQARSTRLELQAVASRVDGVLLVNGVLLAAGDRRARVTAPACAAWSFRASQVSRLPSAIRSDLDHLRGQAPARAARPPASCRFPSCRRSAAVDANGTRYHLLLGEADWSQCRDATDAAVTLEEHFRRAAEPCEVSETAFAWNVRSHEITLRPCVVRFDAAPADRPPNPLGTDRRGAARDRYGNFYWIADTATAIRIAVCSGAATHFWSAGEGLSAPWISGSVSSSRFARRRRSPSSDSVAWRLQTITTCAWACWIPPGSSSSICTPVDHRSSCAGLTRCGSCPSTLRPDQAEACGFSIAWATGTGGSTGSSQSSRCIRRRSPIPPPLISFIPCDDREHDVGPGTADAGSPCVPRPRQRSPQQIRSPSRG